MDEESIRQKFSKFNRKQLQKEAKKYNIKANLKNDLIIAELIQKITIGGENVTAASDISDSIESDKVLDKPASQKENVAQSQKKVSISETKAQNESDKTEAMASDYETCEEENDAPNESNETYTVDEAIATVKPKKTETKKGKENANSSAKQRVASLSPRKIVAGTVGRHFKSVHQNAAKKLDDIETTEKRKLERSQSLTRNIPSRIQELSKPKQTILQSPKRGTSETTLTEISNKRRSNSIGLSPAAKKPFLEKRPRSNSISSTSVAAAASCNLQEEQPSENCPIESPTTKKFKITKRRSVSANFRSNRRPPYQYVDTTKMSDKEFAEYMKKKKAQEKVVGNSVAGAPSLVSFVDA